ncbi:MAG: hypothetical protein WCI22_12865, partial [Actinomycetota bacterium]
MRRLAIAFLIAPLAGLAGLSLLASSAAAGGRVGDGSTTTITTTIASTTASPSGSGSSNAAANLAPVDVLQVSGLFDDVQVRSVTDAISRAESNGSQALILQLNTQGSVVSTA